MRALAVGVVADARVAADAEHAPKGGGGGVAEPGGYLTLSAGSRCRQKAPSRPEPNTGNDAQDERQANKDRGKATGPCPCWHFCSVGEPGEPHVVGIPPRTARSCFLMSIIFFARTALDAAPPIRRRSEAVPKPFRSRFEAVPHATGASPRAGTPGVAGLTGETHWLFWNRHFFARKRDFFVVVSHQVFYVKGAPICLRQPSRLNVILFAFPDHSRTENVSDVACLSRGLRRAPVSDEAPR